MIFFVLFQSSGMLKQPYNFPQGRGYHSKIISSIQNIYESRWRHGSGLVKKHLETQVNLTCLFLSFPRQPLSLKLPIFSFLLVVLFFIIFFHCASPHYSLAQLSANSEAETVCTLPSSALYANVHLAPIACFIFLEKAVSELIPFP